MNKRISEFLGYFNPEKLKNDRRIVVFSVCLLIAVSLWFLNAMGKEYTTTLTYSVKYVNPPENLFLANTPPSKLELNVQAHGFTLLRHKLAFSFAPIVLDLTSISQAIEGANNEYRVPSENLINRIGAQVSKEISINDVSPSAISLVFDTLNTKKVSVVPQVELNFKPQFSLSGMVEAKPDSVEITGPAAILDTILFLQTQKTTFELLDKSLEKTVRIVQPENTEILPEEVTILIPVERFTEKELILPVQIIHLPENVNLKLFPPNVKVTVLVGLSEYEEIAPGDFSATVDYNQALAGESHLEVSVETTKKYIQIMKVVPISIEYLIESE